MADYRIWATINRIGSWEFAVTVSAVPDDPASCERPRVALRIATTRELAETIQRELSLEMSAIVRSAGHRVVDLED